MSGNAEAPIARSDLTTRFVAGGKTYPIAAISSVSFFEGVQLGVAALLGAFAWALVGSVTGAGWIGFVAGIFAFVASALYFKTYAVRLQTTGGEVSAVRTRDASLARDVVAALEQAIIARG